MNISSYLNRFHAAPPSIPDFAALTRLQQQHLLAVPFENLSIVYGEPIVLDEAWLYAKIVGRERGGFCYELNGLFGALLRALGYRVDYIAAEVYNSGEQTFGPPFDHMALLVHLDRPYLVDVGFGESARAPLALPQGAAQQSVTQDVGGSYRLVTAGRYSLLQKAEASGWTTQFRFTLDAHMLDDYRAMCVYHSTNPESHFTRRWICSRATASGRISLTADELIVTEAGTKQRTAVDANMRPELLRRHFALDLMTLGAGRGPSA
jgi:N-hydroxyarylamine O-acetyltransferase